MSLPVYSIAVPFGHEEPSPCRLCTPPNRRREVAPRNCKVAAMHAVSLSVEVYQKMLYRGWARSGLYCYKPDLKKSCCPQYAYRLDALAFQPSKRHRKLLRRWNRRILYGRGDVTVANIPPGRSRQSEDSDDGPNLAESVHAPESTFLENLTPAHRYEVRF
ncbi:hypothetical protein FA13DRAFT_1733969 [Coprinellus micaceus]|uniref:N-end aminoacyl transferase N-terminal domain-containing protein n=1 Tax=Coprinellus micaceus TaxID=71717 RepID=A0A4Y7T7N1_COPMI|nr:hypothetical protein FA13DRAFT_1733969 [Coprinellus micaceus]